MSRYIDADMLYVDWYDSFVADDGTEHDNIPFISKGQIDDAPTIGPKHGKWIDKGWKGDWQFETDGRGNCWYEYKCSECGYIKRGGKSNFCPNCGADMRGKDNEM